MAKSCLGIDIGKDQLKLVLMKGETIQKTASVQMPEGLLKEGRIVSVETTGELIRKTMRENKIRCKEAAVVVSSGICFLRNVTMPEMTPDQLVYNLPYEFRDYIADELKKYTFDYSWGSGEAPLKAKKLKKTRKKKNEEKDENSKNEEGSERKEMELLAAAAPVEDIEDIRLMARKAGLKLTFAAPEVSACENLLHYKLKDAQDKEKEYGILDLGSTSSRLLIFKGDRHQVTRVIERGMEQVEELLADYFHIDIHLAHTWLLANHEDCVNSDVCRDAFAQISVELMRALNFYQFSNPDSRLEDIWICGGGASIEAMRQSLKESLDVNIHDAGELLESMGGNHVSGTPALWLLAAGTALGRTARAPKKQINLALAGQKKKHYFVAIPAIGAIVAAAGFLGKVAVADRLVEMSVQQSLASDLQKQVDDVTDYIAGFGDLQQTYAHYTYQGLSVEELSYINRPKVLKLMKEVIFPKVTVSSWSLSGNQLTLPVTGENLSDINALVQQLEDEKLVDYCNVMTAVTDGNQETERAADKVTGQIVVYLADSIEDEESEAADAGDEAGSEESGGAESEAAGNEEGIGAESEAAGNEEGSGVESEAAGNEEGSGVESEAAGNDEGSGVESEAVGNADAGAQNEEEAGGVQE